MGEAVNKREEVVRYVMESKLSTMSTPQKMTKGRASGVSHGAALMTRPAVQENGTREPVEMWLERHQRRIYYKEMSRKSYSETQESSPVKVEGLLVFFVPLSLTPIARRLTLAPSWTSALQRRLGWSSSMRMS